MNNQLFYGTKIMENRPTLLDDLKIPAPKKFLKNIEILLDTTIIIWYNDDVNKKEKRND